jgi:isopentenyl diphosphate isomerase/L-lactate dehydrogenase-like FMN-dependent dehydrogenase
LTQLAAGGSTEGPINLYDYERLAEERLDPGVWAYYSAGSDDEVTLRENHAAFERIRLLPRIMRGVGSADLRTTVLGDPVSAPVLIAPTAVHGLADPEGECATARAAGCAGTLMSASTVSSRRLEEIAAAATGPLWFQLYVYQERGFAERLVRRAERAGYRAIVLTVDSPCWGRKEDFLRVADQLPPGAASTSIEGEISAEDLAPSALTWDDVTWLRSLTDLPVILKGILHPEDAKLAVEHGASAVVVSNHGGRQLDGVPAAIEALPDVAEAVDGRAEVYLDGGIRRGTDVLKALALGARAVLVGRPVLWGIAVGGEPGARHVLEMLREELERAMVFCGVSRPEEADPSLIR